MTFWGSHYNVLNRYIEYKRDSTRDATQTPVFVQDFPEMVRAIRGNKKATETDDLEFNSLNI